MDVIYFDIFLDMGGFNLLEEVCMNVFMIDCFLDVVDCLLDNVELSDVIDW